MEPTNTPPQSIQHFPPHLQFNVYLSHLFLLSFYLYFIMTNQFYTYSLTVQSCNFLSASSFLFYFLSFFLSFFLSNICFLLVFLFPFLFLKFTSHCLFSALWKSLSFCVSNELFPSHFFFFFIHALSLIFSFPSLFLLFLFTGLFLIIFFYVHIYFLSAATLQRTKTPHPPMGPPIGREW